MPLGPLRAAKITWTSGDACPSASDGFDPVCRAEARGRPETLIAPLAPRLSATSCCCCCVVSHLHLDDEAAVKCAEKLKTSFGMKKFSISLNHISFQGAQALGESRSFCLCSFNLNTAF